MFNIGSIYFVYFKIFYSCDKSRLLLFFYSYFFDKSGSLLIFYSYFFFIQRLCFNKKGVSIFV